jgi:hypothetical protein
MNTVTVYWSPYAIPEKMTYINLLLDKPEKLLKTLHPTKKHAAQYIGCTSAKELYKNTFVIKSPVSSDVTISSNNNEYFIDNTSGMWLVQTEVLDNRLRIDLDFGYIFFAEESLEMSMYPPYLHKTKFMKTATVAAGKYNIGKWFRPVSPSFVLWENEDTVNLEKGEPTAYLDFETDKRVILKQFELTKEMKSMVHESFFYRDLFPFTPLNELYNRFIKSNRHKVLLKLIKQNLTE